MGIEQLIATQAQRTAGPSPMQQLSDMQSLQGQQLQNQGRQQSLTANADALDQGKRMRGLQFAANVGQQIKSEQDPKKKAELYAAGLQFAKMNGHDISTLPQQYDDRAQQFLDVAHMQVYAPKEFESLAMANLPQTDLGKLVADREKLLKVGGDVALFDKLIEAKRRSEVTRREPEPTSSQKDWQHYQDLLKSDPESAKQFGQQSGFVSKEGKELSTHLQKRLSEASDESVRASSSKRRLDVLAKDFSTMDVGGGVVGSKWPERFKEMAGTQDAVTELRKEYNAIRASQAVQNLPPGVASDKDIALALSGFPDENANGEHIASWLTGMAKLEQAKADFADFKASYISESGSERGMLEVWEDRSRGSSSPSTVAPGEFTSKSGFKFKVE